MSSECVICGSPADYELALGKTKSEIHEFVQESQESYQFCHQHGAAMWKLIQDTIKTSREK
jgi:hypothetical protein